ncbi:Uncharacterised protein [Bordetella pertussis]|nr:Uncharacterised protein [Bordetella pertussis]
MVDVDGAPGQRLAHVGRQDLHVARQHHQVDLLAFHQLQHLALLRGLGVGRDGHMVERDAV